MSRGGIWLLRSIGALASAAIVLVAGEAAMAMAMAMRTRAWLAVPELAALEVTVVAALAVAATSVLARGRRALRVDTWTRVPGWRGWVERLALIWCASLAALLGALPGLALGLGPPALWPPALVALAMVAARARGSESPRRVAWVLCATYGLTAAATLFVVRHVL
jgi:hypothetical protein